MIVTDGVKTKWGGAATQLPMRNEFNQSSDAVSFSYTAGAGCKACHNTQGRPTCEAHIEHTHTHTMSHIFEQKSDSGHDAFHSLLLSLYVKIFT